jgi:hypothetical protein
MSNDKINAVPLTISGLGLFQPHLIGGNESQCKEPSRHHLWESTSDIDRGSFISLTDVDTGSLPVRGQKMSTLDPAVLRAHVALP